MPVLSPGHGGDWGVHEGVPVAAVGEVETTPSCGGRSASWSDPRSLAARRTNRHHARQPVVTTVLEKDLETVLAGADSSY